MSHYKYMDSAYWAYVLVNKTKATVTVFYNFRQVMDQMLNLAEHSEEDIVTVFAFTEEDELHVVGPDYLGVAKFVYFCHDSEDESE